MSLQIGIRENQVMPTTGTVDVIPIARRVFEDESKKAEQRGLVKYGKPLQAFNGRDCWLDGFEEAVDLIHYMVQMRIEMTELEKKYAVLEGKYNNLLNLYNGIVNVYDIEQVNNGRISRNTNG